MWTISRYPAKLWLQMQQLTLIIPRSAPTHTWSQSKQWYKAFETTVCILLSYQAYHAKHKATPTSPRLQCRVIPRLQCMLMLSTPSYNPGEHLEQARMAAVVAGQPAVNALHHMVQLAGYGILTYWHAKLNPVHGIMAAYETRTLHIN